MTFTNINHPSKIIKLGGSDHIVEDILRICKSQVRPKTFGKTFLAPILLQVQIGWGISVSGLMSVARQSDSSANWHCELGCCPLAQACHRRCRCLAWGCARFRGISQYPKPFSPLPQTIMLVIGQRFYRPLGVTFSTVHLADKLHRTPLSDC